MALKSFREDPRRERIEKLMVSSVKTEKEEPKKVIEDKEETKKFFSKGPFKKLGKGNDGELV